MKHPILKYVAQTGVVFVSAIALLPSLAQFPKRDLTVELRQVQEQAGTAYSVGTQPRIALLEEQLVQVRNGEKASLSLGKSMPVQWVQSVTARANSGGVTHAAAWLDAGQNIKVHPVWSGAGQLVTVDIEVQSASVDARTGEELPTQSRSQVAATVSAPLGQWITIATTGSGLKPGVYGSEEIGNGKRLLQIRVQAP